MGIDKAIQKAKENKDNEYPPWWAAYLEEIKEWWERKHKGEGEIDPSFYEKPVGHGGMDK